jgi:rhomboid protease GluP
MGGILFSCVVQPFTVSVGASTAIFGLIGSFVSSLIVNWGYYRHNTDRRLSIVIFLLVTILMAVSITGNVDQAGHFGGFLTGVVCGLWLLPEKNCLVLKIGVGLTLVLFGLGSALLFTAI